MSSVRRQISSPYDQEGPGIETPRRERSRPPKGGDLKFTSDIAQPKRKEAEECKFDPWPQVTRLRIWKMDFIREVRRVYIKPCETRKWLAEVDQATGINDLKSSFISN